MEEGLKRLYEMYGNHKARFLHDIKRQAYPGRRVKVMPTDNKSETLWDGVIVRLPKKKPCVRVKVRGRTWFLLVENHQILIDW